MLTLPGYKIKKPLHAGHHYAVFQAKDLHSQKEVIIKATNQQFPSDQDIANLKQELELSQLVDDTGIIHSLDFKCHKSHYFLVQESIGGITLKQYIKNFEMSLEKFFSLAITLTETLARIHDKGIIHKDIKPSNIIINPQSGEIKITDFSISTRLKQETTDYSPTYAMGGTLTYISPEQTGRMNRSLDYRTDLYSLGATFFEILTGRPPFTAKTPIELVYQHIATQPPKLVELNPNLPQVLSNIVDKLLQKNAEDRYQSARGLKFDLERCRDLQRQGGMGRDFTLGEADYSARFQIVQKLYGRETELKELLQAFQQACSGKTQSIFINGQPGVGKTALVHEIHRPITERQGLFIDGKFDQYQKRIPYFALGQAINGLCDYWLGEPPEVLDEWRKKILQAMQGQGQVLIEIIPHLELVLGPQPPLPLLSAKEAEQRLANTFQRFFHALCDRENPALLFLDDMQWADMGSLSLLEKLLTEDQDKALLFIGAFRENEVTAQHPLISLMKEIKRAGVEVKNQHLANLSSIDIKHLISDTLGLEPFRVRPLADFIYERTQGNAFFTKQLLQKLYDDGCLSFSFNKKEWQWDIQEILNRDFTDSVVDLLTQKLSLLSEQTQKSLQWASTLGNIFDIQILSLIFETSLTETLQSLWQAVEEGLIRPINENYRLLGLRSKDKTEQVASQAPITFCFVHDRIQEAAYATIPKKEIPKLHLQIANLLRLRTPSEEVFDRVYEMVSHYQKAQDLIQGREEQLTVAKLSLQATQKAMDATAFDNALNYARFGTQLLQATDWDEHHELMWQLHCKKAFCEFYSVKLRECEETLEKVLAYAQNENEKVLAYQIQIQLFYQLNRHEEGVKVCRKALKTLGVKLPYRVGLIRILAQYLNFRLRLGRNVERLKDLPTNQNQRSLNILKICFDAIPILWVVDPSLMAYSSQIMARQCLRYGNSPYSAIAFTSVCSLMSDITREFKLLDAMTHIILDLMKRYPNYGADSRAVFIHAATFYHWKRPVHECLKPLQIAYERCQQAGLLNWVSYVPFATSPLKFFLHTQNLADLIEESKQGLHGLQEAEDQGLALAQNFLLNHMLWLAGSQQELSYLGESLDAENYEAKIAQAQNGLAQVSYYTVCMNQEYLQENYHKAFAYALKSASLVDFAGGFILDFIQRFLFLLTYYAAKPQLSLKERFKAWLPRRSNLWLLKHFAKHNPHNFQWAYLLIKAEAARVAGKKAKASENYEQAMAAAEQLGAAYPLALCHEVAGRFHHQVNHPRSSGLYLREACELYRKWGALRKVKQLEKKYGSLLDLSSIRKSSQSPRQPDLERNSEKVSSPSIENSHFYETQQSSMKHGSQAIEVLENNQGHKGWTENTFREFSTYSASSKATSVLDFEAILKSSYTLSSEINFEKLIKSLMKIVVENSGAQRACLVLNHEGEIFVEADYDLKHPEVKVVKSIPLAKYSKLPDAIVHYVSRTQENLVLNNTSEKQRFFENYQGGTPPQSALAMPIVYQNKLLGILYLANDLTTDTFTPERVRLLNLLTVQIATSLNNAKLYTDLKELNEQLEEKVAQRTRKLKQLASHDPLTGVYNRRHFFELAQKELEEAKIIEQPLCEIILDADNFKNINDTFGHAAGDKLLINLTKTCRQVLRKQDIIGRVGGDEFAILMPNTELNQAKKISERLRETIANHSFEAKGQRISFTVSMGLTDRNPEDHTIEDLLSRADEGLYRAKQRGRNQVAWD